MNQRAETAERIDALNRITQERVKELKDAQAKGRTTVDELLRELQARLTTVDRGIEKNTELRADLREKIDFAKTDLKRAVSQARETVNAAKTEMVSRRRAVSVDEKELKHIEDRFFDEAVDRYQGEATASEGALKKLSQTFSEHDKSNTPLKETHKQFEAEIKELNSLLQQNRVEADAAVNRLKVEMTVQTSAIETKKLRMAVEARKKAMKLEDLGYFDTRIAVRDPRLLFTPKQLEQLWVVQEATRIRISRLKSSAQGESTLNLLDFYNIPPVSVLQPSYAAGKGLVTQDEINGLKNEYFTQSELSFGMIMPLTLLTFVLTYRPPVWLNQNPMPLVTSFLAFLSFCFFWIGIERNHRYRTELKLLILSRWDKAVEAEKNAKDAKPKSDVKEIENFIKKEIDGLKKEINKPMVVEVHSDAKTEKPGAEPK